jgi:Flp pilus assembly protein TadB
VEIARQAVSSNPKQRPPDAASLARQLTALFGNTPKARKSRWPSLNTILVIIGALLTTAIVIAFALQLELLVIVLAIVILITFVAYWRLG